MWAPSLISTKMTSIHHKKARDLTSDDLLRESEDRARKRPRLSPPTEQSQSDDATTDEESSDESIDHSNSLFSSRLDTYGPRKHNHVYEKPSENVTFASLGVSKNLQHALSSMSINVPTEVQTACIPPLLAGSSIYPVCMLI